MLPKPKVLDSDSVPAEDLRDSSGSLEPPEASMLFLSLPVGSSCADAVSGSFLRKEARVGNGSEVSGILIAPARRGSICGFKPSLAGDGAQPLILLVPVF